MLPRRILAKKSRWFWFAFLTLSPLAYIAGVELNLKTDPTARLGISIDRNKAISIAAQYAASKGIDVTGWNSYCTIKTNNDLLFYYRSRSGSDRDRARSLAPEAVVRVRFRSPDTRENIEILLNTEGQPLGYERKISKSKESKDPGEEVSRKIAEEAFVKRLSALGISQPVDLQPSSTFSEGAIRTYWWRWPQSSLPELTLQSIVSVRGGTLVGDKVEAKIDSDFVKQQLQYTSWPRVVGGILYGLIILAVVIFGIYRFVQRTQQKEVSYSRVILITLVYTAVLSGFILLSDVVVYEEAGNPDQDAPLWVILLSASLVYVVLGLFIGLSYGSGEGDIREAYPGKLASLDALITGRIFSRNVARSVVIGWAFGGWIILLTNLIALLWYADPIKGRELPPLDAWLGKTPWLFPFIVVPTDVILIIVIGLLVPLPFFHRRTRSTKIIILWLTLFMMVACTGPYHAFRPWVALLALAAVRTLLAILAFFKFDLLTAIVGLASPTFVIFVAAIIAQPAPTLKLSGVISLTVAFIVLAVEFFFAFKGRFYSEDEVRPIYAKHLAERLSMQAEVSAAREAQKRLMPNQVPKTPHFSIAASCLPAFEVGGDFYDIFELEAGKLGVLIAEGGGRGLGSALSIAFAKGYLLPKIMGSNISDDSPTEIIRGLQDRLKTKLADEAEVGLIYAVIDSTDRTLRYARTGTYPTIRVGQVSSSDKLFQPEERDLIFKSNLGDKDDVRVIEGSSFLQPGDSVILFTDGIANDWSDNKSAPEIEFAKVLSNSRNGSSERLQETLTKSVNECSKYAKKRGLEDDLTAVIVRLEDIKDQENSR